MSIGRIQENIDASGAAKAIVVLDRDHVAALPNATKTEVSVDAQGRITRTAPAVKDDAIKALGQHFVGAQMVHFPFLGIVHGVVDQQGLANLADHEATHQMIHGPELDTIKPVASGTPDAPPAGPTWGLARLKAPEIWQRGHTGKNIVVAHLDSGVDSQHPALLNSIEQYAVFDTNGQPVTPTGPYRDGDDHGTHTAGTIAGRLVDGGPVIGMAPDVELIDATIVGHGDSVARILAGMNWALEKGARVLNLSVGFPGYRESFEALIKIVRKQHLLPVVAIGNDGPDRTRSPGNYATVLSVGATDSDDKVATFSSSCEPGDKAVGPMLCAPGVKVLSACLLYTSPSPRDED